MNIFATDPNPNASATALADRHVVKMPIESAQILSTVLRAAGIDDPILYRPSHAAHPCTLWAGASRQSAEWLAAHGLALCAEYTRRYGRTHASEAVIRATIEHLVALPEGDATTPPQCVPEEHRGPDVHAAYRRYLRAKYAAWGALARWTRADAPGWAAA